MVLFPSPAKYTKIHLPRSCSTGRGTSIRCPGPPHCLPPPVGTLSYWPTGLGQAHSSAPFACSFFACPCQHGRLLIVSQLQFCLINMKWPPEPAHKKLTPFICFCHLRFQPDSSFNLMVKLYSMAFLSELKHQNKSLMLSFTI